MELFPLLLGTCIVGVVLLIGSIFFLSIFNAYVKTPANRAFVRTGGFSEKPNQPPKVVMNGGRWVFKSMHQITWVDLSGMQIEIEHIDHNALTTQDLKSVDIKVVFGVKVDPTAESIINAARSVGGQQVDENSVRQLLTAKLDGTLGDVTALFTLTGLHQDRDKFVQEVQNRLSPGLKEKGLVLETVSILILRPTHQGLFDTDHKSDVQVI